MIITSYPKRLPAALLSAILLLGFTFVFAQHDRRKPAGPPATAPLLRSLSNLTDVSGLPAALAGNRPVLVAFFCNCPACHKLAAEWASHLPSSRLSLVVLTALGSGDTKNFQRTTHLQATYLLDSGNGLREQMGLSSCPHYYLFDSQQALRLERNAAQIGDAPARESALIQQVLAY